MCDFNKILPLNVYIYLYQAQDTFFDLRLEIKMFSTLGKKCFAFKKKNTEIKKYILLGV